MGESREKAIKEVFAELNAMSDEEFCALIDRHIDGDIALALMYADDPGFVVEPDEKIVNLAEELIQGV